MTHLKRDAELMYEPSLESDETFGKTVEEGAERMKEENEEMQVAVSAEETNNGDVKSGSNADSGLDFNYSELSDIQGVVVGDLGFEISRLPVEKIKFTQGDIVRVAILTDKVIAVKTHYRPTLGNFFCWGGKCCELDGFSRIKYVFPIVQYDTDKRGKILSNKVYNKVLPLSKEAYNNLIVKKELMGSITNKDFFITCDNQQFQNITLTEAPECSWKKSKKVAESIQKFWKANIKNILKPIARTITEQELLRDTSETMGDNQDTPQFDDIFGDSFGN